MNSINSIKPTLIIATYNWKEALNLVFLSVLQQSMLPFEIIIADDGSKEDTKHLIDTYKNKFTIPLIHVWHGDKGFRLAEIRNKAIKQAKGNYIIQIDGDVILHKNFVRDHVLSAKTGVFLVGSRVLIGERLLIDRLKSKQIKYSFFSKDIKNRHYTFHFPLLSKILRFPSDDVQKVIKSVRGCNMSFWKSDLIKINGYDESMTGWGREDSELSARLINLGLEKHRLKFSGIQYHVYHKEHSREGININDSILEKTVNFNLFYTPNGIYKQNEFKKNNHLTAIIPTFNEEKNIAAAIKNLSFADEILIIDSFSTDKTIEIAKQFKVKILQRTFDNFSSQKNYAIINAQNNWILMLDADERLTTKAINEIVRTLNKKNIADAFWMHRQNYFLGKKISFSGWQNDKVIKLFNRTKAKYNGKLVHEEIECSGKTAFLKSKLLHYTYREKEDYKKKIELYAKLKSEELFKQNIKPIAYHFYFKPVYRFVYHYIFKLGFLDGKSGFTIAKINAYGVKKRYDDLKKRYESSNQ